MPATAIKSVHTTIGWGVSRFSSAALRGGARRGTWSGVIQPHSSRPCVAVRKCAQRTSLRPERHRFRSRPNKYMDTVGTQEVHQAVFGCPVACRQGRPHRIFGATSRAKKAPAESRRGATCGDPESPLFTGSLAPEIRARAPRPRLLHPDAVFRWRAGAASASAPRNLPQAGRSPRPASCPTGPHGTSGQWAVNISAFAIRARTGVESGHVHTLRDIS